MEKLYFCIEKEKEDEPGFRQSYFRIVVLSKDKEEYDQLRTNYKDRDYGDWYFKYQDHVIIVENADEIINNLSKYERELLDHWDFSI